MSNESHDSPGGLPCRGPVPPRVIGGAPPAAVPSLSLYGNSPWPHPPCHPLLQPTQRLAPARPQAHRQAFAHTHACPFTSHPPPSPHPTPPPLTTPHLPGRLGQPLIPPHPNTHTHARARTWASLARRQSRPPPHPAAPPPSIFPWGPCGLQPGAVTPWLREDKGKRGTLSPLLLGGGCRRPPPPPLTLGLWDLDGQQVLGADATWRGPGHLRPRSLRGLPVGGAGRGSFMGTRARDEMALQCQACGEGYAAACPSMVGGETWAVQPLRGASGVTPVSAVPLTSSPAFTKPARARNSSAKLPKSMAAAGPAGPRPPACGGCALGGALGIQPIPKKRMTAPLRSRESVRHHTRRQSRLLPLGKRACLGDPELCEKELVCQRQLWAWFAKEMNMAALAPGSRASCGGACPRLLRPGSTTASSTLSNDNDCTGRRKLYGTADSAGGLVQGAGQASTAPLCSSSSPHT